MRCSNCGNDLPEGVRFCPKCGTAIAPATTPFTNAQPTTSFGAQPSQSQSPQPFTGGGMVQQQKKSGCGKALVIVLVIGALLLATLGGIGYFGYRALNDKLKSSEAYTVAVATLKENPTVADKMGAIKETGFPVGSFHEDMDGTGEAAYHMSVTGTKTNGSYNVVMMRRARKWYLTTGSVTLADGEVINLSTPQPNTTLGANDNTIPPPPQPPGKGKASPIVSGGVLDGKAVSKPDPAYPAAAKAAKASGTVIVQVTVDESGKVVSAHAVSGHPLLQSAAVAAAYQARFTPTLLSGRPVKVNGVLTYNFDAQ